MQTKKNSESFVHMNLPGKPRSTVKNYEWQGYIPYDATTYPWVTFSYELTGNPLRLGRERQKKRPVLLIRGDQEPMDNYPAEHFKENCAGPCEVVIVPNCNHFYVGAEDRVSKVVTEWLERMVG